MTNTPLQTLVTHAAHHCLTNPPADLAPSVDRVCRNGGRKRIAARLPNVVLHVQAELFCAERDGRVNGNRDQLARAVVEAEVRRVIESVAAEVWCAN